MANPVSVLPGESVDPIDAAVRPLLQAAGAVAVDGFRHVRAARKQDGSIVTAADHAAERLLVDGLIEAFPADAIVGEEGTSHDGGPARWFVDPLDGTRAFVEGLAHWGPTIARVEAGHIRTGATWLPQVQQYFHVCNEAEAFLNGERMSALPRRAGRPDGSLFVPSRFLLHLRLDWPGRTRGLGSIAAHLALVAAGGVEGCIVGPGWAPWDVLAGLALMRAVGGEARGLDGTPLDFHRDVGIPFAAGTARAVEWLTTPGRIAPHSDRGHRG